jgi:hypothetical protein
MAPMVDDKYMLLARFGNKVQEVAILNTVNITIMDNFCCR